MAAACASSSVDGQDVVAVYNAANDAVARARRGEGPSLIEAVTYRIGGHSSTSPEFEFMDLAKMEAFKQRDPLVLLRKRMLETGAATADELSSIEQEVARSAEAAVVFAKNEPFPDSSEATRGLFVDA